MQFLEYFLITIHESSIYFFECIKNFYLCALTIESLIDIKIKQSKVLIMECIQMD